MKIIKNNCIEKKQENIPKQFTVECDKCGSELEITEEDTYIGWLGAPHITCPCCGEECMVDDLDGITLTKDNLKFPVHFIRTVKELRHVIEVNSDEIIRDIQKGIEYFRNNKDEYNWYTSHGDLFLIIYRYPGDEEYFVMVTKDYYETYIPFELEDYNKGE